MSVGLRVSREPLRAAGFHRSPAPSRALHLHPGAGPRRFRHAAVVMGLLVLWCASGCRSQEEAPKQPSAAASPTPLGPALFESWLKYESSRAGDDPTARDAYLDAMLGHQVFQLPPQGLPSNQARELLLPDDKLMLSTGRRLWAQEAVFQPGLTGKFCYLHSGYCVKKLFDVTFFVDGKPMVIYDNQYGIQRYPSHTLIKYYLGAVIVEEARFITENDRAVAAYTVRTADKKPHDVRIEVIAPYLPVPNARSEAAYPLLGAGSYHQIPLYIYLDAPGFSAADTGVVHLRRSLQVPADGAPTHAGVAVSFETTQRQGIAARGAAALPDDMLRLHQRDYNRWFVDHVPYFDAADMGFKKMWYYRWWLVRFNMTEADTSDLKGYRFYEGKLGFDNPITFAVPAQIKDLTYLRDKKFAQSQILNAYRNLAPSGAIVDPPGSPYWGETYSHWTAAAILELHHVHPLSPETLRTLLPEMARDVRAWVTTFDPDGDGLPQSGRPRITGYDLDILSYWYFNGTRLDFHNPPPDLERVDFASFVYANARALSALARIGGNPPIEREFAAVAERLRSAAIDGLWDDETEFFYPRRANDNARAPIRELHGFFPFLTQMAPNQPRYLAALRRFVDPQEFWARFPPVITSQHHYRGWNWEMDGLTRNIAPHPISMGARTLLQVLKHYDQNIVTPGHFMELMERYNELVYPGVNPFDRYWRPNAHEYYSKWEPYQSSPRPKPSEIWHDFHSMFTSLVVEGVVGLTPRSDEQIEIDPLALAWPHFLIDRLRYRDHDLTIVWDEPDGNVRYDGLPEGFSLYLDGNLAFTRQQLGHVIYDPAAGNVREVIGPSPSVGG